MKRSLIVLIFSLLAVPAAAQKQPMELDSCLYTIPASAFKRVPVFLEATADPQSVAVLPGADLFAQSVAFRLRELMGGNESKLADADSLVDWNRMWGEILVTVHREEPLTWSVAEWSTRAASPPVRSSLGMLKAAINDVVASGETVTMPEGFAGDWVTFGLSLVHPRVTKDGKLIPVKGRQPVPVFTIAVPWEKSVELTRNPNIVYPELSRLMNSIGNVRLAFAVNKEGRVDVATIKELWPPTLKRPTGDLRNAYEAFLRSVIRDLPTARFSPAVIGGCVVKQMVEQTFEFRFR